MSRKCLPVTLQCWFPWPGMVIGRWCHPAQVECRIRHRVSHDRAFGDAEHLLPFPWVDMTDRHSLCLYSFQGTTLDIDYWFYIDKSTTFSFPTISLSLTFSVFALPSSFLFTRSSFPAVWLVSVPSSPCLSQFFHPLRLSLRCLHTLDHILISYTNI